MIVAEVLAVRDLGVLVPLGRENAFAANRVKAKPQTANPREQINEPERGWSLPFFRQPGQALLEPLDGDRRRAGFAVLIADDGTLGDAQKIGGLDPGKSRLQAKPSNSTEW